MISTLDRIPAHRFPNRLTFICIHPITPIDGELLPTLRLSCEDNACKDKNANRLTSFCLHSLASICFILVVSIVV